MSEKNTPSHEGAEFFITEIDSEFQQRTDEFLNSIRKEHQKINDIVGAFQGKVDKMVDKQRGEYIQAYESHMQDVQRELHTLREKVHEMANNHTKNERTEKLKSEIIQFKRDALQLETDSDHLRSTMTKTVQRIYVIEKSRDWMLRRLRKAKKQYNNLLREKSRLLEEASFASLSHDSTYTLDFTAVQNHMDVNDKSQTVNSKFKRGIRSHADVKREVSLPLIKSARGTKSNGNATKTSLFSQQAVRKSQSAGILGLGKNQNVSELRKSNPWIAKSHSRIELGGGDDDLGRLVAIRSLTQELRQFVSSCQMSLNKRPWSKVQQRGVFDLLSGCEDALVNRVFDDPVERENPVYLSLLCELAVLPDVYEVIHEILSEKPESGELEEETFALEALDEELVEYHREILNWNV